MDFQNSDSQNEDNQLTKKQIFSLEFDLKSERIAHIADDMQSMLNQSYTEDIWKTKHPYLCQRAGAILNQTLILTNQKYEYSNKRPPQKNIQLNSKNYTQSYLKKNSQLNVAKRNKNFYGQEKSVKMHKYDDYAPMAASVSDFKELYIPKTIKNIWTGNYIEFNNAVKLKADLQAFLDLTNKERVQYMSDITNIRTINENDIKDDACDKELLGHRGIFATKHIPAMAIIGVYAGVFIIDTEDMIKLTQKIPLENFQDYLFRVPIQDKFPKISGYQHSNRLSIINAASNYKLDEEGTFNQIYKRANIMLVSAKTNECPIPKIADNPECPDMLFFIAGRDIHQGTQLLYDYGPVYW